MKRFVLNIWYYQWFTISLSYSHSIKIGYTSTTFKLYSINVKQLTIDIWSTFAFVMNQHNIAPAMEIAVKF